MNVKEYHILDRRQSVLMAVDGDGGMEHVYSAINMLECEGELPHYLRTVYEDGHETVRYC